ncbi:MULTISPECIES: WYL domain-containing protein [unclassified Anaerobiospirillum]|uniref:WYL domain-containing protein n=1 Tax=unclassified Anaerobiospirillum TaxID=2647410 RepID=UPI001FF37895|nr:MULTISPECIES: WYL domain-containing protein [unclassified Anaerobiospirillum]MCK0527156.1 WYL domain-containing protein [Anaerobiospirillum sp. NML120449]MCK0534841.1 WYL domain-containing protein [Anaerobiospirillum sp. NML120511]MCK0540139.1 WYL domain-containing protein [Anaerobiospirillum sp. NML02-A-032]
MRKANASSTSSAASGFEKNNEQVTTTSANWGQQRRLEFIDFRLSCDGRLNRRDLVEFFNISVPQASLDLSRYNALVQEAFPPRNNLSYDRHLKYYIRTDDFKPLFPELSSPRVYLNDLLGLNMGTIPASRNIFGYIPGMAVSMVPQPLNNIDSTMLFNLIESIRERMAVHITYMNMASENDTEHLIAPHAFAFDGRRWYVRAYCYYRHGFRDFVLSRIVRCDSPDIPAPNDRYADPMGNGFREMGTGPEDDRDWNEFIDLVLRANPRLPRRRRRAIEMDYGMEENGTLTFTTRRSLVYYALDYFNLADMSPEGRVMRENNEFILDNEMEIVRRLSGGR